METNFTWIKSLSDDELFQRLREHGVTIPVTASSRSLLEKRLAKLLGAPSSPSSASSPGNASFNNSFAAGDSFIGSSPASEERVHRRTQKGNDTFGNSFYIEEVDAKPSVQRFAKRASEAEQIAEEIRTQKKVQRALAGETGSSMSRTVLTILGILLAIGLFLVISYMTQAESGDEIGRIPKVKMVVDETI